MQAGYTDEILQRLYKRQKNNKLGNFDKFKSKFLEVLQSKDTEKECWIVQPGISLKRLKGDPNNKMHTILNFVESVLKVNNIGFKLMASK